MIDIKFYDTSSLLLDSEKIFNTGEKFIISSVTLMELENIKTSHYKDEELKYNARKLTRLLDQNRKQYEVIVHTIDNENYIYQILPNIDMSNDLRILSDAIYCNNRTYIDRVIFVTNDLCLKEISNLFFGDEEIKSIEEEQDDYTGYKIVCASDDQLAEFYSNLDSNFFNLIIGEYLILVDKDNNVIDLRVWTGEEYRLLTYGAFSSDMLGVVKPYEKDCYQKLLFDSLMNNKITMVKGPPGTGKSLVSLGYLMSKLENGDLDKIVIFCNTVATANSAKLGFYPGSKDMKLLDSQIDNMLASKFGSKLAVEQLINDEKLILLPFSDIRGYDTTGMRAGIYISEAQNLDITLIKLALQRIGEDCICIIDGDEQSQVDMAAYAGARNGMRRVSKVYRGHNIYGEVTLQNIYRSEIARIADEL